ncbi:TIGR03885 family FMN-dependent LLM class oxidoreductase [Pollutibacter soli]|uniref:TIGR03885 family FMN-dependent LLM class oxidoreductase n=1 Tax=Pollutibacter soli TaxID=3034157 RepID=UPI0030140755
MSLICYHASHEQFPPSELLRLSVLAEKTGFQGIHSSDHFHPWSSKQGQSGFTFSWIAAAMQATQIPFSMVCAPGQRYHPAIVAQAIATLGEMFPKRFSIELGSGEALNEAITGDPWPDKKSRDQRLLECAKVIRLLLQGNIVDFNGLVTVKHAKLYTLPEFVPELFCAALTNETSAWAGTWADGLLTTGGEEKDILEKMKSFYKAGGEGKPVFLQFAFSYAHSIEEAKNGAYDQWRSNVIDSEKFARFSTVEEFEKEGEKNSVESVIETIRVFDDMEQISHEIDKMKSTGAARIVLHNVNTNQEEFIRDAAVLFR